MSTTLELSRPGADGMILDLTSSQLPSLDGVDLRPDLQVVPSATFKAALILADPVCMVLSKHSTSGTPGLASARDVVVVSLERTCGRFARRTSDFSTSWLLCNYCGWGMLLQTVDLTANRLRTIDDQLLRLTGIRLVFLKPLSLFS